MGCQKTQEEFLIDAHKVHGDKYDYSKTVYKKALEKIIITCHCKDKNGVEHGDFMQTPNSHLYGRGCPKCGLEEAGRIISERRKGKSSKPKLNENNFKELCGALHHEKYLYEKAEYKRGREKIVITCPEHGDFEMTLNNHYYGKQGCPECARLSRIEKKKKNKEDFISKASYIHSNFYNYDKVVYEKARKKVIITCPVHGDFEQSPDNHLKGCGCPNCTNSSLERKIRRFLIDNNITFLPHYRTEWLKTDKCHSQSLDFYLPDYNLAIECQGIQHFKDHGNFGSKTISNREFYEICVKRDKRKYRLCKKHNTEILYYSETKVKDYFGKLYYTTDSLLEAIITHGRKVVT